MTTSVLYSSTDVGAPQLGSLTAGSVIAVLSACLVNGYGGKASLGWTMPFYDVAANLAVYRNDVNTGSGCYLRVHDNKQLSADYYYSLRMYSSMSTIDTGIDPIPLELANSEAKVSNSTVGTTKWYLIGDNRGFYFTVFPYFYSAGIISNCAYTFYAGDIESFVPSYKDGYGLFGNSGVSHFFGSTNGEADTTYAQQYSMINRNPITMKYGAVPCHVIPNYRLAMVAQATQRYLGVNVFGIPQINGVPYCTDNLISIADGVIGKLPGLIVPTYKTEDVTPDSLMIPRFFVLNGRMYLRLTGGAGVVTFNPIYAIHIGQGFR